MMVRLSMPHLRRIRPCALAVAVVLLYAGRGAVAQTEDGPEDAIAIFNQAQDLHERGDLAGAIKLYEKALHAVPEFPEAEYQRGMAELALGNKVEAEKSFRRALEQREDWSPAMTSLGSLLVDGGQFSEAEKLLSKALAADPQNSSALAAMVDLRLSTKASPAVLKELLEKLTTLTAKANPTASAWAARAALEAALGQRGAAKQSLANALAIDPKNRSALFLSANLALSENDIVKAKEAANALEKLSANADSLNLLKANIAATEGDLEGASKLLVSLPTDSAKANELRARIASSTTTAADLEKQLDADPKNAAILGRLCSLLRRDAPLKALDYCRRASEAEPANIAHVIGYAAALVQARQFDKAVALLRKLIEIAPDNSTAHANLATALFELKRYAEAMAEFEWLTSKQPNLAVAYYFLAICHDQLREFPGAIANYQQYLRLADPVANKLDIEKVTLRLSQMQKKTK
jgi:tetratricopeptide (TPR) repeat protein